MSSEDLARKIAHWTKLYQFCGAVSTRRTESHYVVEFLARTTKTRASSMVTRVKLIVDEVAGVKTPRTEFIVGKELLSPPPSDRASLATWRVYVSIAIKKRLEAA